MNAIEVIRIGRSLSRAAVMTASRSVLPCCCPSTANSTITIAFFAAGPITVTTPILKYMSFGTPNERQNATTPSTPSGTTSRTAAGIDQLSYNAARHRNPTTIDSINSVTADETDNNSCNDCPVQSAAK